jgi:hypothetical protein
MRCITKTPETKNTSKRAGGLPTYQPKSAKQGSTKQEKAQELKVSVDECVLLVYRIPYVRQVVHLSYIGTENVGMEAIPLLVLAYDAL